MSLRVIFALLLGGMLLIACGLLFTWSPLTAIAGLAFALASAVITRLISGETAQLTGAGSLPEAGSTPSLPPGEQRRQSFPAGNGEEAASFSAPPAGTTAVAEGVPAVTLLRTTMDSMREGVLVVDSGMRVVASNRAAHDLFSTGDRALTSRRLSEVTRNPSIHSAFTAALERGERVEVKVETLMGERRVFDLHVAPLRQQQAPDAFRGAVGVLFDITRLERLERVRQEFLSNVSHELRTPLTAIIAFVETLEAGAIDDPANNRRFLTVIRRNSERMHNLIDDILELSAIEAGTVTVEKRPVRLHSLVSDCITVLTARAAEHKVELRNEIPADTIVYADARRLEQVLTNLIDNAIKFNREGGSVRVGYERVKQRDRIGVTDTGEGIAPEHIERIFERFYRIDRARSRALGGTGLGLAIVKHLARAHGGEAAVRSTPNQGSTFTIELPAAETHDN